MYRQFFNVETGTWIKVFNAVVVEGDAGGAWETYN